MKRHFARCVTVMLTLLPLAATAAPLSSPIDPAYTRASCSNGWANSYASRTCRNAQISSSGSFCQILAKCSLSDGREKMSSITVRAAEVSSLNNCNGNLKIGGC